MVAYTLRAQREDTPRQKFARKHDLRKCRALTPSIRGGSMIPKDAGFRSNFCLGARYVITNFPSLLWSLSVRMVLVQMLMVVALSIARVFCPAHFDSVVHALCTLMKSTAHVSTNIFECMMFVVITVVGAAASCGFATLVVMYGLFVMVPLLFGRIAAGVGLIKPARIALKFAKTILYPPRLNGVSFLRKSEVIAHTQLEKAANIFLRLLAGGFSDKQGDFEGQVGPSSMLLVLAVRVLFLSPFFEELLFRAVPEFCLRYLKKAREPVETRKRLNSPAQGQPLKHGFCQVCVQYPPMLILSGILFASLHVPRQSPTDCGGSDAIWLLVAVGRFTVPLFASINILSPLYAEGRFAASLGAHCIWNLIMLGVYALFLLLKSTYYGKQIEMYKCFG